MELLDSWRGEQEMNGIFDAMQSTDLSRLHRFASIQPSAASRLSSQLCERRPVDNSEVVLDDDISKESAGTNLQFPPANGERLSRFQGGMAFSAEKSVPFFASEGH